MSKYINVEIPDAFNSIFPYHMKSNMEANQVHMEKFPGNIGRKRMHYCGAKSRHNMLSNFTDVNSIILSRHGLNILYC